MSGCSGKTDDSTSHKPPVPKTLPKSITGQELRWHSCPPPKPEQGMGRAPGKNFQCSTLRVPLDYAQPSGKSIGIALIRSKTKDQERRRGSLLLNFGGPGGSGVAMLPLVSKLLFRPHSSYDLVSFDPRGVGASSGVTCLKGAALDRYYELDFTPETPAERARLKKATARYIAACQKDSGAVLPHVGTENAARDMDVLREVLGEKRTNYFGVSYGTELGAVYAHLFPRRVGRFVLDGAVDPTESGAEAALHQTQGFQMALEHYMDSCARQGSACPTGSGGEEGNRILASWLKKLDGAPLTTSQGRPVTADVAETGIASALYDKKTWPVLTKGLRQGMSEQRGDILRALADAFVERDPKGRYSTLQSSHLAISCADSRERPSAAEVASLRMKFMNASKVFGASSAEGIDACNEWPVRGRSKRLDVSAAGAKSILVIGQTGDPATPVAGARKLARALGRNVGVDITVAGEGHGAYFAGKPCLTRLVDDYLLWNVTPSNGTHCV
ncbi:alpha/beta hydrolase [Streptomyces sp. NPDC101110]|uniref:alpha/beta hydrolase n=1 Tax=Streptomyces sp. NPDC101110 TaxID=3366104 RepID=UPI0038003B7B